MPYPLKYPPEALKRYLLENPRATYEEIAKAFSGVVGGVEKALHRYKIKMKSIPGRGDIRTTSRYRKEELESYFASHPETNAKQTAKFFNGTEDALYKAAKRYGLTIPNRRMPPRKPPRKSLVPRSGRPRKNLLLLSP